MIRSLLILSFLFITLFAYSQDEGWYIPEQKIDLTLHEDHPMDGKEIKVGQIHISNQVTLFEYKLYLKAIKFDSVPEFYESQLPDKSIASTEVYQEYLYSGKYDHEPVSGVSWDQAMNFCKWLSKVSTAPFNKTVLYRLPHSLEWFSAMEYLNSNNIEHDFSKEYSDWMINNYDYQEIYEKDNIYNLNSTRLHKGDDPNYFKRRLILGSSITHKPKEYFNQSDYSFNGRKFVSFRIVKVILDTDELRNEAESLNTKLANSWGLKNLQQSDYRNYDNIYYQTENGLMHGVYKSFYPNGKLKSEGRFENNIRKGIWKFYNISGELERKRLYINNLKFIDIRNKPKSSAGALLIYDPIYEPKRNNDNYFDYHKIDEINVSWAQRIWRETDLSSKSKLDVDNIYRQLYLAIEKGEIKAYSPEDDDFNTELTSESEIKALTAEDLKIIGFRITEDAFIDSKRLCEETRIIGLYPIAVRKSDPTDTVALCWLYYPTIRKTLAGIEIGDENQETPAYIKHIEDVFWYRYFSSIIIKEDNVYDKGIPADQVVSETEKIELFLIEAANFLLLFF